MSAEIIVLFSLARVSTLSVVVEKTSPPWFESTPAAKMPEAVVRPVSHIPSFGGHCCPGVSRPVPADGDSSSSSSGPILPSVFPNLTYTLDEGSGSSGQGLQHCTVSIGVTIPCACAASRFRFSTYRLITASSSSVSFPLSPATESIVFCQGLVTVSSAGVEIAFSNFYKSDLKQAVYCSGVSRSER